MNKTRWIRLALVLGCCAAPSLVGCGGGDASNTTADNGQSGGQSAVAQADSGSPTSQNPMTVVENGVGTEPAQCVAIFLDSLRSGDERAANGVLTQKAREELAKTAYEMQPLGTPEGQFEIGRVGYPGEQKDVALVECVWAEPASAGEPPVTMDIVCQVHLEPEGWRISGIGVTIPGTEEALVLDFEDSVSLQRTIDTANGQAPQQSEQQVQNGQVPAQMVSGQVGGQQENGLRTSTGYGEAGATQQAGSAFQGIPSYPGANATNANGSNAGQQQTAMPPQYDGINR